MSKTTGKLHPRPHPNLRPDDHPLPLEQDPVCHNALIDLEHGRAAGTVTTWHALAHAFDVPIEQLLGSLCDDHTPPGPKGA
ncbi:hypothetical protein [Streptomyces violaceus]|uniref:HTH cro/C1-type domain-containing protein n=1 Tax=Streptomyces violaceus TaxID=1936 RepID=A0ABZ1P544_STRVL